VVRWCPSGGAPAPAGEPSCGSGRPRILLSPMTLLADLEEFVRDDRPHGPLTADATAPARNGYLLTVACACGVVFGRWVTPEEADRDLLELARRN
jgi:hypothetical protein